MGNRGVARKKAQLNESRSKFEEKWNREEAKRGLTLTRDDSRMFGRPDHMAYEEMKDREQRREDELERQREKREKFEKDKREDRQEMEKGEWLDLESQARTADEGNTMEGYWREWLFLIGSLGLVMGALSLAFGGTGAERIACLIIVGLVIFSIYVGGVAWTGSIINNVKGGTGIR